MEEESPGYDIYYNGEYAYSTPGYEGEGAPPPVDPFTGEYIDPETGDPTGAKVLGFVPMPSARVSGLPTRVSPYAQGALDFGWMYPRQVAPMAQQVAQVGQAAYGQVYKQLVMKRLIDEINRLRRMEQLWNPWRGAMRGW